MSPREVFRRFWPYTRGGRRWFAPVVLFSLIGPALDATEIWLFKIVVDDVLVPRDVGPLLWIAPTYLGLIIGSGILGFADDVTSTWVSERFLLTLRSDVFRHVQSLSLGFFERRRLGDVLSRVTGDVDAVETFLLSGVADALYYVIRLGVFLGLLFYLQWDLTLLALVIVPLFWGVARRFSRLIKEASRERRRRSGSISAIAEESLGNVALVQAYNRQRWEERRFERENVGRFRATMASTRIRAVYGSVVEVIEVSGVLAVMSLGTWKLAQEQLTLGGLLVFLTLIGSLYSPVRGLSHLGTTFYAASASAERIIELLDQRPQVVEAAGARRIGRARGDVEFDGVSFRYPGTPSWALSDVSFHVAAGETLALVGASGAGKSTVAKLRCASTTPTGARSASTGRICGTCACPTCGRASRWSCRRRSSSTAPCGTTSPTAGRRRRRRTSSRRHAPRTRTSSSNCSRRATTRWSASAAGRSPAGSASAWRSPAR